MASHSRGSEEARYAHQIDHKPKEHPHSIKPWPGTRGAPEGIEREKREEFHLGKEERATANPTEEPTIYGNSYGMYSGEALDTKMPGETHLPGRSRYDSREEKEEFKFKKEKKH